MSEYAASQERVKEGEMFDENVRAKAEEYANRLDNKLNEVKGAEKRRLRMKADSVWEAIGILDGMSKREAVQWVQEHSGGNKGAEISSAGEHEGMVWSVQTACHELTPWKEILTTVAKLSTMETVGSL